MTADRSAARLGGGPPHLRLLTAAAVQGGCGGIVGAYAGHPDRADLGAVMNEADTAGSRPILPMSVTSRIPFTYL